MNKLTGTRHGRRQRGARGRTPPWIFIHGTNMVDKNDVISSVRKHYCAVGLELGLELGLGLGLGLGLELELRLKSWG